MILGFGLNNDGSDKVGYTAPSVRGQAAAIASAHRWPASHRTPMGYVEAHGTGTILGDPIELSALTEVFRARTDRRGFCGIGSVKSNFGHLSCASGVAGLIKTMLTMEHGAIPPTVHFRAPNPALDLAASPFYVVTDLHPWERGEGPRRAAVSSFGVGGTNAHVVLEEPPALPAAGPWPQPSAPGHVRAQRACPRRRDGSARLASHPSSQRRSGRRGLHPADRAPRLPVPAQPGRARRPVRGRGRAALRRTRRHGGAGAAATGGVHVPWAGIPVPGHGRRPVPLRTSAAPHRRRVL